MTSLSETAQELFAGGRGILAADESPRTMSSRLQGEGIEATETSRRDYRELLVSAENLSDLVSGVILADETFGQTGADGRPFPELVRSRGILPGIKVDTGTVSLPRGQGATITEGLDGLRARLASYAERGAAFAKWRAVFDISCASDYAIRTNAAALGRYAALCQEAGIVPIVEPEVLASGNHSIQASATVTERALNAVFAELALQRVDLEGIVLKPNFVTGGLDAAPSSAQEVAAATAKVLRECVPAAVPGIAFLSGGHDNARACEFLAVLGEGSSRAPWALSFSFGRALVSDALREWGGKPSQVEAAQQVLLGNCGRAADAVRSRALAS